MRLGAIAGSRGRPNPWLLIWGHDTHFLPLADRPKRSRPAESPFDPHVKVRPPEAAGWIRGLLYRPPEICKRQNGKTSPRGVTVGCADGIELLESQPFFAQQFAASLNEPFCGRNGVLSLVLRHMARGAVVTDATQFKQPVQCFPLFFGKPAVSYEVPVDGGEYAAVFRKILVLGQQDRACGVEGGIIGSRGRKVGMPAIKEQLCGVKGLHRPLPIGPNLFLTIGDSQTCTPSR